jgi:hypothetical protein
VTGHIRRRGLWPVIFCHPYRQPSFLACWKDPDPVGAKNAAALVDAPRPPQPDPGAVREAVGLLTAQTAARADLPIQAAVVLSAAGEGRNQARCRKLATRFLRPVADLRDCGLARLVALGHTLHVWREEIATMWRFTRNNATTEGFHNKMEVVSCPAYRFGNFQNYRLRVRVMCS